jgi:uncharacterized protein YdeI (YjbR/CyaY-like superfamily)
MSQKFHFEAVIEDAGSGGAYVNTGERVVHVPDDFQEALAANPEAGSFFTKLSYTHQKETVRWIEDAKRESTRLGRIERAIERLKQSMRGI